MIGRDSGMWPNRRALELFGIDLPIIQAPMAGPCSTEMVIAVCEAGGLGSLPAALLDVSQLRNELIRIRAGTRRPYNVNFFCHQMPAADPARDTAWREKLAGYYHEWSLDPQAPYPASHRAPFDEASCALLEEFKPAVVSFHFGLPAAPLLQRVRDAGAKIISSATTVEEAKWLEDRGCDAIIAQGFEAGGHRGNFLSPEISTQVGLFALVPQMVDAVKVPIIAAGGIADPRGVRAAFALGAAGVQVGTAYLFCPEAKLSPAQRSLLAAGRDHTTALTNVFTGRPARGIVNRLIREVGPMADAAPPFPLAGGPIAPLRAKAESAGSTDFTLQWAGQSVHLGKPRSAGELTRFLAAAAD